MQFIGIDLHANKFTCCYRDKRSADKRTETFDLTEAGLAVFCGTLTADTRVPERDETDVEVLKEQVLVHAAPFMREIGILTSMKGISVFTAIAIIADIIEVSRFKNSKYNTRYLRSAPKVSNSNTSTSMRETNKQGRKLAATLLTQSLNHVLDSSLKLRRWYERLCEYKKAGLVRTGLRRRVLAEIYQMLKKGEYHYARDAKKHEAKLAAYKKLLDFYHRRTFLQNFVLFSCSLCRSWFKSLEILS
ncbi:hypothetical protein FACS1894110_12410 [Spirochaetia bacterium]|nr:hypothetical protein FACS1894110_12410 [Spirochaetia bacterium]